MIPNIFVTTGADSRADGPFKNYSLLDTGVDTDPTTTGTEVGTGPAAGVTTFLPVRPQFVRAFDQGDPEANCGYTTEAVFRGTVQPTSVVECSKPLEGTKCPGDLLQRVFFGGTRLSLPNTKYAPPTPLACGTGEYPCRSQFDSILYALGVKSGEAAYDLNAIPQLDRDFVRPQLFVEQSLVPVWPDVDAADLARAWADVLGRAKLTQHHRISRQELSVREHMTAILRQLQSARFVEFADLFAGQGSVPIVVVHFVAMLELAKETLIEITQAEPFAPIYVRLAYSPA
jgi:hypothetical protein